MEIKQGEASNAPANANQSQSADSTTAPSALPPPGDGRRTQNALKARKRTKTGCLTCRKRRIKCGEERPTCANCVKSKRACEGYAPRVIFKDPLGASRGEWWAKQTSFPVTTTQNGAAGQYRRPPPGSGNQSQLPPIAPRPPIQDPRTWPYLPHTMEIPATPQGQYVPVADSFVNQTSHSGALPPQMPQAFNQQGGLSHSNNANFVPQRIEMNVVGTHPDSKSQNEVLEKARNGNAINQRAHPDNLREQSWQSTELRGSVSDFIPPNPSPMENQMPMDTNANSMPPNIPGNDVGHQPYNSVLGNGVGIRFADTQKPWNQAEQTLHSDSHFQNPPTLEDPRWIPGHGVQAQSLPNYTDADASRLSAQEQQFIIQQQQKLDSQYMDRFPAELPAYVEAEDDPWDIETDEEEEEVPAYSMTDTPQNDLQLMRALSTYQDDRQLRSYTQFLNGPNILSAYRPTYTASPLMDAKTARVFCHFVTATGPSLSIYERRQANPQVLFSGAPVPISQQSLWTYTIPMMALSHQGLLHAMLALASLHISKLQRSSQMPSLRHYHFALRRIAKAVGLPTKRQDLATIAACLILSFYEATTGEHSKWNSHLTGARQLLMEIDFKGTTKQLREYKSQTEAAWKTGSWPLSQELLGYESSYTGRRLSSDVLLEKETSVDERVVGQIMGWRIRYDQYGHIVDDIEGSEPPQKPITPKDIETYRLQADLFWWYCKQDVYQSIISSNPLLMPYDRWGHCPPRAPLGEKDAAYGTMDHMVLLMGRVADFQSRDQLRKRKVVEANGGQWRPPPGMFSGPPPGPPPGGPSQPQSQPNLSSTMPPPPPPMYGMVPAGPPLAMPDAFAQAPRDKLYFNTIPSEDIDLDAATIKAEIEWHEIRNAFDIFEESLGPDYLPLSSEYMQTYATPFGPALFYRTYSISDIWVWYYMGLIILTRSHPSMPPAATMAAGIAAPQTADWANTIGRIAAGLQPTSSSLPLNPSLGAALMESTCGLFFSGVQFSDPLQRRWTVDTLRNIALLTGWHTSSIIAAGCETYWIKAAELGRGPPWQRTGVDGAKEEKDDRIAGRFPNERSGPPVDVNDRRFVKVSPSTRLHWGFGVLSLEEDFVGMRLGG